MGEFVATVSEATGRLARRLRGKLGVDDADAAATESAKSAESDDYTPEASLFRCSHCEVTYISLEMESCPRCSNPVNTTPTEVELGMV